MWSSVAAVSSEHKDVIHAVSFSASGRRLATCSSDQSVKVWDESGRGSWVCSASWKTHAGSVWRVIWAHPEFGQILATCSFDRTAVIWEEVLSESEPPARASRLPARGHTHWLKRCTLVDSRSNITDIAFAPHHLGLQLATVSQSGMLRLYEAPDVLNVSQWSLQEDVSVSAAAAAFPARCSALSWSTSRCHAPLIAVASDDPAAPGAKLAVFQLTNKKWEKVESLTSVVEPAYDVAFAPAIGRSFHLLAVASKRLYVFTLRPNDGAGKPGGCGLETQVVARLDDNRSQIWRVAWNVTGTILASTAADGIIKLWKANHRNNWSEIGALKATDSKLNQTLTSNSDIGRYY